MNPGPNHVGEPADMAPVESADLVQASQSQSAAFALTVEALLSFSVDPDALDAWVANLDPDDFEADLPAADSEYPSRDLSCLVCTAIEHHALTGDPRLHLAVYEGDDDESTGYYVVLRNEFGDQRLIGITSGWTELSFVDAATTLADQAREYLTEICAVANTLLGLASRVDHAPAAITVLAADP